ncbi:MAG: hypothetical protein L3J35_03875 [Bacteroidales bacterium]|nr:hypothetical protein [Bacteroidales bacterium]
MFKRILILSFAVLLCSSVYGQFLHFGVKTFITPKIYMKFFEYEATDYVYYFSNEKNETIRFSGLEESEANSNKPYPDIYIRYDVRNHLFFQAELFGTWFTNEAKYLNSVDFPEYTQVFNPVNERENLGYNTIKLQWGFTGNSLSIGYIFSKTKALRPYIFAGGTALYLMKLEQGKFYDDERQLRNDIIFSNLSTFKKTTLYAHGGFGFKYKALSFDVYYRNTIADADIYANNYFDSEDISISNRPNYDYFDSLNISISLNILSFNLSKNHLKE